MLDIRTLIMTICRGKSSDAFCPRSLHTSRHGICCSAPLYWKFDLSYEWAALGNLGRSKCLKLCLDGAIMSYVKLAMMSGGAEICGVSVDDVRHDVMAIMLTDTIECQLVKKLCRFTIEVNGHSCVFQIEGKSGIRRKTYLDGVGGRLPTNYWSFEEVGHTDEARKNSKIYFQQ